MKKLSAILLIGLFAFSQYARQLSYLECKFTNIFKTSTDKCDCEKKAGFDNPDSNKAPLSKVHTHIHLDELFTAARLVAIDLSFKLACLKKNPFPSVDELEGNYPKPWQPPTT
ncbi:MAG: hypothetical protein SGI83_09455 [Bacteroidota bacterium]|nr:hypothetical protein [Bacteroidota bacterium]